MWPFKKRENKTYEEIFERLILESNFNTMASTVLFGGFLSQQYSDALLDSWIVMMTSKYKFIPRKRIEQHAKELESAISIFRKDIAMQNNFETVGNC